MIRLFIWGTLVLLLFCGGCAPRVTSQDKALSHHKMAQSYLAGKNYTAALKELLVAQQLNDRDAGIQAALGEVYFNKKAYSLAEKHYKNSLTLQPDNPNVENNLAALYLDMKQWQAAAVLFHKVSQNLVFSHPVQALIGLGVANHYDGQYLKAIIAYNEALDYTPKNPDIFYLMAKTYMAMEKYDLARLRLEKTLSVSPEFNAARMLLGEACLHLGQTTQAAEAFREVANREDQSTRGNKAREYLQLLESGA